MCHRGRAVSHALTLGACDHRPTGTSFGRNCQRSSGELRSRDRRFACDRAHVPVHRAIGRLRTQSFVNQLSQSLIVNRARLAWTYFVVEPVDALLQESNTPPVRCEHASPSQPESSANALLKSCEHSSSFGNSSAFGRPMGSPMGMLVSSVPLIPACYVNID
jgi:hypothetical protein